MKVWVDNDTDVQAAGLRMVNLVLLIGGALTTLIAAAMGFVLSRSVVRPVVGMTAAMKRLAGGDHAVDVPSVGRGDEIGQMAAAVQTFKDAALQKQSGSRPRPSPSAGRPRPTGPQTRPRGARRRDSRRPWSRRSPRAWTACPRATWSTA